MILFFTVVLVLCLHIIDSVRIGSLKQSYAFFDNITIVEPYFDDVQFFGVVVPINLMYDLALFGTIGLIVIALILLLKEKPT